MPPTLMTTASWLSRRHLDTPQGQHEPGEDTKARRCADTVESADGTHSADGKVLANSRSSTPTYEAEHDVQESSTHSLAEISIC